MKRAQYLLVLSLFLLVVAPVPTAGTHRHYWSSNTSAENTAASSAETVSNQQRQAEPTSTPNPWTDISSSASVNRDDSSSSSLESNNAMPISTRVRAHNRCSCSSCGQQQATPTYHVRLPDGDDADCATISLPPQGAPFRYHESQCNCQCNLRGPVINPCCCMRYCCEPCLQPCCGQLGRCPPQQICYCRTGGCPPPPCCCPPPPCCCPPPPPCCCPPPPCCCPPPPDCCPPPPECCPPPPCCCPPPPPYFCAEEEKEECGQKKKNCKHKSKKKSCDGDSARRDAEGDFGYPVSRAKNNRAARGAMASPHKPFVVNQMHLA
ncbi:hypothetical protein GQ54DRAFT_323567 [Martensiomyces pterosporus]|nr:hypothetical protein GQ54DRAFT_323567 [Martensiomyces pterosporus]